MKNLEKLLTTLGNLKRSLTNDISNPLIDKYYNLGLSNGAIGGKLLGAGGGWIYSFFSQKRFP